MLPLPRLVTISTSLTPAVTSYSTTYCMLGLSTTVSSSFGVGLVAGSIRVPNPTEGITALVLIIDAHPLLRKNNHTPPIRTLVLGTIKLHCLAIRGTLIPREHIPCIHTLYYIPHLISPPVGRQKPPYLNEGMSLLPTLDPRPALSKICFLLSPAPQQTNQVR